MSIAYAQTEYLSELLGNIDDSLLDEAFAIDSAAALRRLKARERWEKAKKLALSDTVRRAGALVACAALVISMLLSIPAALKYIERVIDAGSGVVVDIPISELIPEGEAIVIDSLDKLNYYSALRALDGELGLKSAKIKPSFAEGSLALAENGAFFLPDGELEISMASFFCIMVDKNDGYLYERFGEGKLYVAVTKNSFADMITFRKGSDFYTCFASEVYSERMVFTSERYANGFAIAEQTEGERFSLTLDFDGKYPDTLMLASDENTDGRKVELLRGTSAYTDDVTILSVNELEKYYANKFTTATDKENDPTDNNTQRPTDRPDESETELPDELSRYAGVYGIAEDYRGTLSFPNLENVGEEHIALWSSETLGEYRLTLRIDGKKLIFASEDGAIAGSIELYDDRIYLNVEHSTVPEMLLGSYMFEVE